MKNTTIGLLILAGALSRLIPHTPNFTAIAAIAILGGALLTDRVWAVILPVAAMVVSDLILGLHSLMLYVYLSMALIALASSFSLKGSLRWTRLLATSLGASLFFFIVTNFGVWLTGSLYEKTWDGLVTCYVMALPFLGTQAAGDLFYSALLFGAVWALRTWKPQLIIAETPTKS